MESVGNNHQLEVAQRGTGEVIRDWMFIKEACQATLLKLFRSSAFFSGSNMVTNMSTAATIKR
jgi:dTDP-D-glucose 4,6-dehydratase